MIRNRKPRSVASRPQPCPGGTRHHPRNDLKQKASASSLHSGKTNLTHTHPKTSRSRLEDLPDSQVLNRHNTCASVCPPARPPKLCQDAATTFAKRSGGMPSSKHRAALAALAVTAEQHASGASALDKSVHHSSDLVGSFKFSLVLCKKLYLHHSDCATATSGFWLWLGSCLFWERQPPSDPAKYRHRHIENDTTRPWLHYGVCTLRRSCNPQR